MKRRYTVLLEQNPGTDIYTVSVPALPGVVTEGQGVAAALANARDAIALHIESLEADGEGVPEEEGPFSLAPVEVDVAALAG